MGHSNTNQFPNSPTPTGCPTSHFGSDINCPEMRVGSPRLPHFRHQPQMTSPDYPHLCPANYKCGVPTLSPEVPNPGKCTTYNYGVVIIKTTTQEQTSGRDALGQGIGGRETNLSCPLQHTTFPACQCSSLRPVARAFYQSFII